MVHMAEVERIQNINHSSMIAFIGLNPCINQLRLLFADLVVVVVKKSDGIGQIK